MALRDYGPTLDSQDSGALRVDSPVLPRALEPYPALPYSGFWQGENGSHQVIIILITLSTSCLGMLPLAFW